MDRARYLDVDGLLGKRVTASVSRYVEELGIE
jgi:hypothetical protein